MVGGGIWGGILGGAVGGGLGDAADCDYFADPTCDRAQTKFFYQWKLGGEVKSTESSWAHAFDKTGTYTVDWAVRDPKEGEEDWAEETNDSKDKDWDFTGTITVDAVEVKFSESAPTTGSTAQCLLPGWGFAKFRWKTQRRQLQL